MNDLDGRFRLGLMSGTAPAAAGQGVERTSTVRIAYVDG
jgi:hypothetical protein